MLPNLLLNENYCIDPIHPCQLLAHRQIYKGTNLHNLQWTAIVLANGGLVSPKIYKQILNQIKASSGI